MTSLLCTKTNRNVSLVKEIANSGEGKVWRTNWDGYLAKIYHDPTIERIEKLEVMIAHPPKETVPNHVSFAWATSVLKDSHGKAVGFLMPEIKQGRELIEIYSPRRRKLQGLEVDWNFLHTVAYNTAAFVRNIHQTGYVIGDIKPQNILVNNRALPSIIDTDSFQVRNPKTGRIFRCLVGSDGFTPPELLGKDLSSTDQTEIHDRFRLAIIIYLLLFGDEPFKGKWMGAGDSPDPVELLKRGWWAHGVNSLIEPSPTTISLEVVHPEIKALFLKCFNQGHSNASLRPSAEEWKSALAKATNALTVCGKVDTHFFHRGNGIFHRGNGSCYWCDRHKNLGVDIFEFKRTVISTSTVSNSSNKVSNNIDIYSSEEILELVAQEGRNIRVIGKIDNTPTARGKLYINFEIDFKKNVGGYNPFYAVIFSQTLQQFAQSTVISKLQNSQGQYAEISGILKIYDKGNRKSPQIIINDPNQIELLNEFEAINLLNSENKISVQNVINKNSQPVHQTYVNNNVNNSPQSLVFNPLLFPPRTFFSSRSSFTEVVNLLFLRIFAPESIVFMILMFSVIGYGFYISSLYGLIQIIFLTFLLPLLIVTGTIDLLLICLGLKYIIGNFNGIKVYDHLQTPDIFGTGTALEYHCNKIYACAKYHNRDYQRALLWSNKIIIYFKSYRKDDYYNRGIIHLALGNYQKAINDFRKQIKLNKQDADSYYGLGYAYSGLGNQQQSDDNFKIAKSLGRT
jgi:serine/threonine protein kinase